MSRARRLFEMSGVSFFDSDAVLNAVDKARFKVLKKQGRLVKKAARASLRVRKKPSQPGNPPNLQIKGSPLKTLLFFGYDHASDSVVVGPTRFQPRDSSPGAGLLEHGGRTDEGHAVEPRPFMQPAIEEEAPNFAQMWKDAVQ